MSVNVAYSSNPSCSGEPSLTIGVGYVEPIVEWYSDTQAVGYYENGDLYVKLLINNLIYAHGNKVVDSSVEKKKKLDPIGFKLVIPEYTAYLPSFTIPKFPKILNDCDDCLYSYSIPTCDWKWKSYKSCVKKLGVKVCATAKAYVPTKCQYQIEFVPKTFPKKKLFSLPRTVLEFSCQIIPEIAITKDLFLGVKVGGEIEFGADPKASGTNLFSRLVITKLKAGLKIKINKLHFRSGRAGFVIKNLTIPVLMPFDLVSGDKYISIIADSLGNLSVWYDLKSYSTTLYQILDALFDINDNPNASVHTYDSSTNDGNLANNPSIGNSYQIPSNILSQSETTTQDPNILDAAATVEENINSQPEDKTNILELLKKTASVVVLDFLKTTIFAIDFGLLLCPLPDPAGKEDAFLSFVASGTIACYPFGSLNRLTIPEIPENYTQIPEIPSSKYLVIPDDVLKLVNKVNQNVINKILASATKELELVTNYIKNVLEQISVYCYPVIPLTLIYKNVPIIPGV